MHVFISYSHADGDFAEILRTRLEQNGFNVWTDEDRLLAGEDWRNGIDEAIRSACALIVVMTPSAKASEYVTYEWAFAWGVGVKVIPILLEPTLLHPRLEVLQYLDFSIRAARQWDKLLAILKELSANSRAGSPQSQDVVKRISVSPVIQQHEGRIRADLDSLQLSTNSKESVVKRISVSPVIQQHEGRIRADLDSLQLSTNSKESVDILVQQLAVYQFYHAAERIYRQISGSQIAMLKRMNLLHHMTREEMNKFYDEAAAHLPAAVGHLSFEAYTVLLRTNNLIILDDNADYRITALGREFLQWMVSQGIPEQKAF